MIATAERPRATLQFEDQCSPAGTEAHALALAYLQYASACWRGDSHAAVFASRLGAFWRPEMPPAPAATPDAISPHGGGGRGVSWRHAGGDILGYIPGARGGFQIPIGAIPRLVACATRASRTAEVGAAEVG